MKKLLILSLLSFLAISVYSLPESVKNLPKSVRVPLRSAFKKVTIYNTRQAGFKLGPKDYKYTIYSQPQLFAAIGDDVAEYNERLEVSPSPAPDAEIKRLQDGSIAIVFEEE